MGAGLGLAISKKIATSMGGDIAVESKIGAGSKFEIDLEVGATRDTGNIGVSLVNEDILMLCDAGVEADILYETMNHAGANVQYVCNLSEALTIAETHDCRFKIIVDERLGLCEAAVNANWPEGTQLIALIEPSQRKQIGAAFNAAQHSFLTRPVRPSTMLRILSEQTAIDAEKPINPNVTISNSTKKRSRALKVLLAEDNPVNALLAIKLLERNGHSVCWVENGSDAVASLKEVDVFDVVLMDLHMPVMDGLTAIKTIRKMEEDGGIAAMPVFMVTADGLAETTDAILAAGCTGILEKPLNIEALESVLLECRSRAA